MKNFWLELPKPFFVLAPMYDVTDSAFRQIIAKYSRPAGPQVFFTEFVSADGLASEVGRDRLKREFYFTESERPIVAQIFSAHPDKVKIAAALAREMGFDGIDINMGCPDRAVLKQGSGAALIKTPNLALEIIAAAKEGAGDLPVSVKSRIGYNTEIIEEWTKILLAGKPAALTFHLRTVKELSLVPAHWDLIKIPVALARGTETLIVGNGDVATPAEGKELAEKYGVDGIMIGRGIFGNPWLWSGRDDILLEERLRVLVEHSKLFSDLYCQGETNQRLFADHTKNFDVMKKHFKAYIKGFDGAGELRAKLMECKTAGEVEKIVKSFGH